MKLPRDVSGAHLAEVLCRRWLCTTSRLEAFLNGSINFFFGEFAHLPAIQEGFQILRECRPAF